MSNLAYSVTPSVGRSKPLRFSFPVVRVGQVCVTDRPLDQDQSRFLAERIQKDWDNFRSASVDVWRCRSRDTMVSWGDEKVQIDTSMATPVVRFPTMVVRQEGYSYASRMHVTVCAKGNNSKVWCRIGLSHKGKEPADLIVEAELTKFYNEALAICRDVTSQSAAHYKKLLFEEELATSFDTGYEIIVKVAVGEHPDLQRIFELIRFGRITSMRQVLDNRDWAGMLEDFLRSAHLTTEHAREVAVGRVKNETWELQLSPEYGTIYFARVAEKSVEYIGVAQTDENPEEITADKAAILSSRIIVSDLAPLY